MNHSSKHRSLLALALLFVLLLAPTTLLAETFSVGVVPQFEQRKLNAIWQPILDRLHQQTGHNFRLEVAKNIPEFELALHAGAYQFAYMNPYHLILAHEQRGYLPLVRDHGLQLFGVLVAGINSDIESPTQLNGKMVAFPAPNALGASLQMRQELKDIFDVEVIPQYVKTHDAVYLNVKLGMTAAGGGVQKTLNRQAPLTRNALRIIHTTRKVAPHPLAVLPSVPEPVAAAVTQALLDLGQTPDGQKLLAGIPMKQIGPATLADYQPLQKMVLDRFYVPPQAPSP